MLPNLQKPPSRAADKRDKSKAKLKAWLAVRRDVFARDGHLCRVCGSRDHIDVHHITLKSAGGLDSVENCLALCRICHADVHAYRLFLVRDPKLRFIRAPK